MKILGEQRKKEKNEGKKEVNINLRDAKKKTNEMSEEFSHTYNSTASLY